MDVHDTIGFDLVGMVVDDLVVCGAEPLFMTDYIACGRVVPERIAAIVKGIAEACVEAGCALVGGETAEHPGLLGPDEYDVAGATTGVVEADDLLGPARVRPGDAVLAMASSGLHSNGYSLVRHVRRARPAGRYDRDVPELGRTLGEELLDPDPDLRQGLPGAGRRATGPTRWRTSPAAGWPPTSPACCPRSCTPCVERGTLDPGAGLRPGPPAAVRCTDESRALLDFDRGSPSGRVEGRGDEIVALTQWFQLTHGAQHSALRHTGTLGALEAMAKAGLIPEQVSRELDHAYVFLRTAEHRGQLGLGDADVDTQVEARRRAYGKSAPPLIDWQIDRLAEYCNDIAIDDY